MRRAAAAVLLALLVSGCASRVGQLPIATTQDVRRNFEVVKEDVEGSDCVESIFLMPFGDIHPDVNVAIDEALAQAPNADALVDAEFHRDVLIAILFNQRCIRVTGDLVRTR